MRTITTQLFPTSSGEFAFKSLRSLWPRNTTNHKDLAMTKLKEIINNPNILITSSGRSSIATLLESLKIGSGDEVILQSFTCSVVASSILSTGATPVYADINPDTLNISPESLRKTISPRTKIVIFQHTFGSNEDLSRIANICRSKDILLLEDKAHILGNGKLVGDMAIGSFGRSKWLSSIIGGFIETKEENLLSSCQLIEDGKQLINYPKLELLLLNPSIVEFLIKPSLGQFKIGEVLMELLSWIGILTHEVEDKEKEGKLGRISRIKFPLPLYELLNSELSKFEDNKKLRNNAVNTYLKKLNPKLIFKGFTKTFPYLYFPLKVEDPQSLYLHAKKHKIYLGNWYYPAISPPGSNYLNLKYDPTKCPNAEQVSPHIVNLPTFANEKEVQRVVEVINNY